VFVALIWIGEVTYILELGSFNLRIARSDALAYPDSTQATECVRLKQMFNPLVPNTVRSEHHFVWKEARGQKGPDKQKFGKSGKRPFPPFETA